MKNFSKVLAAVSLTLIALTFLSSPKTVKAKGTMERPFVNGIVTFRTDFQVATLYTVPEDKIFVLTDMLFDIAITSNSSNVNALVTEVTMKTPSRYVLQTHFRVNEVAQSHFQSGLTFGPGEVVQVQARDTDSTQDFGIHATFSGYLVAVPEQ